VAVCPWPNRKVNKCLGWSYIWFHFISRAIYTCVVMIEMRSAHACRTISLKLIRSIYCHPAGRPEGNALYLGRCLVRIYARTPYWDFFRDFSQFLQVNSGTVSQLDYDQILHNSSFINHPIRRYTVSILTASLSNQATNERNISIKTKDQSAGLPRHQKLSSAT
jgi:hypothetical protein